jgi:hypothetical protein
MYLLHYTVYKPFGYITTAAIILCSNDAGRKWENESALVQWCLRGRLTANYELQAGDCEPQQSFDLTYPE